MNICLVFLYSSLNSKPLQKQSRSFSNTPYSGQCALAGHFGRPRLFRAPAKLSPQRLPKQNYHVLGHKSPRMGLKIQFSSGFRKDPSPVRIFGIGFAACKQITFGWQIGCIAFLCFYRLFGLISTCSTVALKGKK